MSRSGPVILVSLLLVLAVAESLAVCDYHFQLSGNGTISELRVKDTLALVKIQPNGTWIGYVKEGSNSVVVSNSTGLEAFDLVDLPEQSKSQLYHLVNKNLTGARIYNADRSHAVLDLNGNSVNVEYRSEVYHSYKLVLDNTSAFAYVDGSAFDLDQIFYHNNGPVIIMDKLCRVRIVPLSQVNSDLKKVLEFTMVPTIAY